MDNKKQPKKNNLLKRLKPTTAKEKISAKAKLLQQKERAMILREQALAERENDIKRWEASDEQLTQAFFMALANRGGHRGLALADVGLSRSWFKKKIATDTVFYEMVLDTLEDSEDFVQAVLFNNAMQGNTNASQAYFKQISIEKTKLAYQKTLPDIEALSKDKPKALEFVIIELFTNYNTLKLNGREALAMMALKQIVDLLGLTSISDLGQFEMLRGTDLIKLMDSLNMKPTAPDEIKYEAIEDADIREHYKKMYPQQILDIEPDAKE